MMADLTPKQWVALQIPYARGMAELAPAENAARRAGVSSIRCARPPVALITGPKRRLTAAPSSPPAPAPLIPKRTKRAAKAERKEILRAAFSPEKTVPGLAEETGFPDHRVRVWLKEMGLTPSKAVGGGGGPRKATLERRERLKAMAEAGQSLAEMARAEGVSRALVTRDLAELRLKLTARETTPQEPVR
ncbi:hypothetical protein [Vannielia litorea]|uniref:hypothetical protein n=1 Tax=Vannielia litorea TaxID=1217970 RepID=UPI001BCEAB42|nr:hypothetical protein [Vannielia litorea]MBS8227122.1 hypothetical protein [Vannielia litorea]